MAKKLGNGGHSQENYDPETGKYISSESANSVKVNSSSAVLAENKIKNIMGLGDDTSNENKSVTPKLSNGKKINPNKLKEMFEKVRSAQEKLKSENYAVPFNRKDREWDVEEDRMAVNPNYEGTHEGIYTNNCQRCAPTYALRRMGYDVEALPIIRDYSNKARENELNPWYIDTVFRMWDDPKPERTGIYANDKTSRDRSWKKVDDYMDTLEDGAIVQIIVEGHTFCCERINGKNICIEPQVHEKNYDAQISHRQEYTVLYFCRLDNLKPNRNMWGVCKNREIKEK